MSSEPPIPARRANRLAAVQFLYAYDMNRPKDLDATLAAFFLSQEHKESFYKFSNELIRGTIDHLEEIDGTIQLYSQNWKFSRIAKTDLAILRLALYELIHREDIPPVVSINEAIDLTKMLSDEDSKRFVNGILDEFKKTLKRPLRTPKPD